MSIFFLRIHNLYYHMKSQRNFVMEPLYKLALPNVFDH